jgi:hypothetical protein
MRTIKTYSNRAPFYNAFVGTNSTGEPITSGLPVTRDQAEVDCDVTDSRPISQNRTSGG